MVRSSRKQAAAKFRKSIARSNELHAEYLNDPDLYDAYDRFTRWQFGYMVPFFDDLLEPEGYADAVDFIVSDLCGVGVSERDHEIERATPVFLATLPTRPLESAAAAVELNARSLEINLAICHALQVDGTMPEDITEALYFKACRGASSFEAIMGLVQLAAGLGDALKSLVHIPLIGGLLKSMRVPAHAAGFGALQEFLETGYTTFRRISDIDDFLDVLGQRLNEVFRHIYFGEL